MTLRKTRFPAPLILLVLSVLFSLVSIPPAFAGKVTILRDEWGVPRILGDSREAVAFGYGYAQAEDRLEEILKNYLLAEGRMASVFGADFVEEDYRQAVLRHAEVSRQRFADLSPESRSTIQAFVAGVRKYMEDRPEKVPAWGFKPEPFHVVALMRHSVWGWPVGQAFEDLGRALPRPPGAGSNEWAVSPERTAKGCAVLCIDPHVGLTGVLRWYEAHLHGGDWNAYGFSVAGTHVIALGHNDFLAWTCTTGGPDTSDVYEVELDPKDKSSYLYDGERRGVESRELEIAVRTGTGTRTEKRTIRRTHHGPIIREDKDRAFAMKLPYEEEVGMADQFLAINLSRNLNDFRRAMSLNQLFPQNVMMADVDGNIFYLRTGRVPIRPALCNPSRPLAGNTSRTEWLGLREISELVQCLNPPQGFFQNCNIGPDTMMPGSPMTPERYSPEIYGAGKGATNPRGRRAVELLSAAERLTVEQAIAVCLDTGVWGYRGWVAALQESVAALAFEAPEDAKAIQEPLSILAAWDGNMESESAAATLYHAWQQACRKIEPPLNLEVPPDVSSLSRETKIALARALARAVRAVEKDFGSFKVAWGQVNRLQRDGRSFPMSGASPKNIGISTLRAVGTRPGPGGTLTMVSGQTCPTVVVLEGPGKVASHSALPFGESDDPASPHFMDQGEKLFSPKKLKDTRYRGEERLEIVESRKVLDVPGSPEGAAPGPSPAPASPDARAAGVPGGASAGTAAGATGGTGAGAASGTSTGAAAGASGEVSAEELEQLARMVATPHKLGRPVLEPTGRKGDFDSDAVDCPNVFKFRERWHMTYIGHDGTGYRTGLATSDDLIHWERRGCILDKGPAGAFDAHGAAGLSILGDGELLGGHEPHLVRGKYWLSYYGNDEPGYEAGYGFIGLAASADLTAWARFERNPILSPKDGAAWEKGTLYKSFLFRGPAGKFYLFYNAKDSLGGPWVESTGLATSDDLAAWKRESSNPILPHGPPGAWDSAFASDPIVFHHRGLHVMFYYGFDGRNARDGLAASRDLIRWKKYPRPILDIGPPGAIDSQHAHKPSVVWDRGAFFHFYCSVRDRDGFRAITVASSKPFGG